MGFITQSNGTSVVIVGGGAVVKQVEVDFGPLPVADKTFTIVDADVSPTSNLIGAVALVAPTGKELDEVTMDTLDITFSPGVGQFSMLVVGRDGYIADKFKINYAIG